MYLYDNLQKFITLDKYNEQKGPPYITATNYIDRQQTPSANAIAAQGVQSLTTFHSASGYGSQQKQQFKKFTLLSEYFNKPPRVLTINRGCNVAVRDVTDPEYGTLVEYSDKIKTIAMGCTDIGDPENNNNAVLFFLKISLFLGMTSTSCYFLYFYRKYKH